MLLADGGNETLTMELSISRRLRALTALEGAQLKRN
jgi:hypothetical protein